MEYYSFAGNIGTGKSTAASLVSLRLGVHLLQERVAEHPYLERFYADPVEWAFRMQMFNLANRSRQILEASERGDFVLDRSFEEDFIYVDVALARGFISDQEYSIYGQLFELALRLLPRPTCLLYLRVADLNELHARIAKRARGSEEGIDHEYLGELQERYDSWFEVYAGDKILVEGIAGGAEEVAESVLRSIG